MSTNSLIDELKKEILDFDAKAKEETLGEIAEIGDGIAKIYGLRDAKSGELLTIESKNGPVTAMVLNLEETSIGAIILGAYEHIEAGDKVKTTGEIASINVGEWIIGRVVDPIGKTLDDKGNPPAGGKTDKAMPIEKIAPGVITRQGVTVPLQTGIKAIDALIPIGRGQRELIIGDRGTGKTAIAIDTIINQKNQPKEQRPICIYVGIGQKKSKVARIVAKLEEAGALEYTTIVLAGASDPASFSYLAPYAGCAIGEYFLDKGRDVLIIFDDLTKQAWAYRQISLLLRRPPGREAYPGDVFYLHSRLLERSCRLNKDFGGGSMTALPIIETQAGDVSAYIPTNVISITDGQIFLESDLFYQGIRPALNIGISVSRVGGAAQIKAMKKVAGKLKLQMAQYRELAAFAQFASDLDAETKKTIERGKRITEVMKQPQFEPMAVEEQVIILYAANNGYLDGYEVKEIIEIEKEILTKAKTGLKDVISAIKETGEMTDANEKRLQDFLAKNTKKVEEAIVEQTEKDSEKKTNKEKEKTEAKK
ncbi:F0F1 ATP synthase subunit alpha [Candidatus Berkelbacteria bacterium CG10_big_fil_rev_8_21_14_0_10_43_13]|uniref:ATP synthase subunit alpha n=1 Tax=Candidatus Berkelbacteria bacterium CG10_big_fil_rev_8_21_14_0_10_43_13 TaxID=1974514 RepID=A0A2H0W612_9BACT|nr:F0F1 ATP synthase subunit alpha [bacterium]PIS07501.1 MAG: F0F1 ATP synthase subunit alpha [Candidatus Berkelbacteria bacterium CG10_big_fil_rev_8_21_14_0_10_43_13]